MNQFSNVSKVAFGLLFVAQCNMAAASGVTGPQKNAGQSRYPYCNVYTVTACFGISGGDELHMSMPADFTIYDIKLANSVKARIYLGYNPESGIFVSAKPCEPRGDVERCGYVTAPSTWDVLYAGEGNQPFIHVHIEGNGDQARRTVHDFLGNFRSCTQKGSGLTCTEKRIFAGVE